MTTKLARPLPLCPIDGRPVRRRGRRGPWPLYCSEQCKRSAWARPAPLTTAAEAFAELEQRRADLNDPRWRP